MFPKNPTSKDLNNIFNPANSLCTGINVLFVKRYNSIKMLLKVLCKIIPSFASISPLKFLL